MNERRPLLPAARGARWRPWLRLLLAAALVAALLALTDVAALGAALRSADPGAALAGLLCFGALVVCDAWRLSVAFARYRLSFATCLGIQVGGFFLSNFTPGMAGAEVLRVVVAHRAERGLARAVTLTLLLRLFGLFATFVPVAVYALLLPERLAPVVARLRLGDRLSAELLLAAAALAVLAAAVLLLLRRRVAARTGAAVRDSLGALRELGGAGGAKLAVLSLVMVAWGAASLWFFARAVGVDLLPADTLVVLALLNVGSLLPITPGGLGLREGAIAGGLVLFGAATADAIVAALLHRAAFWAVSLAGGLWLARWRRSGV